MRLAPSSHRAYTYEVTIPPAESAVPLALFKQHIKVTTSLEDALLQLYLDAAIKFAEDYTKRDLIVRTYETFRDFFPNPNQNEGYYTFGQIPTGTANFLTSTQSNVGFEIRRSPLKSVTQITYIDTANMVQTVSPTVYYNSAENDYSEILQKADTDWPTDVENRLQTVTITFTCGLFVNAAAVSANWIIAIMNHAANLEANRGDCSSSSCMNLAPPASLAFYEQERIINI